MSDNRDEFDAFIRSSGRNLRSMPTVNTYEKISERVKQNEMHRWYKKTGLLGIIFFTLALGALIPSDTKFTNPIYFSKKIIAPVINTENLNVSRISAGHVSDYHLFIPNEKVNIIEEKYALILNYPPSVKKINSIENKNMDLKINPSRVQFIQSFNESQKRQKLSKPAFNKWEHHLAVATGINFRSLKELNMPAEMSAFNHLGNFNWKYHKPLFRVQLSYNIYFPSTKNYQYFTGLYIGSYGYKMSNAGLMTIQNSIDKSKSDYDEYSITYLEIPCGVKYTLGAKSLWYVKGEVTAMGKVYEKIPKFVGLLGAGSHIWNGTPRNFNTALAISTGYKFKSVEISAELKSTLLNTYLKYYPVREKFWFAGVRASYQL